MESVVRLVRLIQIAFLASIVLYAVVGELVGPSPHSTVFNNTFFYALSVASITTLGVAFVVRRTLVLPTEALLRDKPKDALLEARWKTGYIVLYALCEVLALFGLVLRFSGFALAHVWGFYAGGFLLLILFSPRVRETRFR